MHRLINLILLLLCLSACAIDTSSITGGGKKRPLEFPHYDSGGAEASGKAARPLPWEAWSFSADLSGAPLVHPSILQGDEYLRRGDRRAALEEFKKAYSTKLQLAEQEALVMRKASTELALDRADEALATMSTHFRLSQRSVDEVDPKFSLVFAYAYGRSGDVDQSLAWFSRTFRISRSGPVTASAEQGVRLVLRATPSTRLGELVRTWHTDSFVHAAIGEERRRRTQRGYQESSQSFAARFWKEVQSESIEAPTVVAADLPGLNVGALLPLSGQYAALGKSLQRGIELAFEAHKDQTGVKLLIEDTAGDPLQAAAKARELIAREGVSVILGPLLSEEALSVSEIARSAHVMLLTFSKKSNFATGRGVYRLGPTSQSQVESLITSVRDQLDLRTFGIVFPQDENGHEFAQQFRDAVGGSGLSLVFETAYARDDPGAYAAIAQAVEANSVQALFMPDGLAAASRIAASLNPRVRDRLTLLGTANWDDYQQLSRSQGAMRNAVFLSPFFSLSRRPFVAEFISVYSRKFGGAPDFLAAQAFDAATLLFTAAERRVREPSGSLEEALQQIVLYDGLTGKITVDAGGEFRRNFSVLQLRDDGLVELGSEQAAGGNEIAPQLVVEPAQTAQAQ